MINETVDKYLSEASREKYDIDDLKTLAKSINKGSKAVIFEGKLLQIQCKDGTVLAVKKDGGYNVAWGEGV